MKRRNANAQTAFVDYKMTIEVTEKAVKKLTELNTEHKMLRIKVVHGGCSGLSYKLGWDDLGADDQMVTLDTISIIMDPKTVTYTIGMKLDYTDGLEGTGFVFINPNATSCCHCGSSFNCR